MEKKLSEMSLEELWHLFPIILTEHQDVWSVWFEEEKEILASLLQNNAVINHIGSTAIQDIWAKPIIDILIELPSEDDLLLAKDILVTNGYICMSRDKARISLNKGYTENGFAERVFHIHLRIAGDNAEIAFRDLLISDKKLAKQYEKLKLDIWKTYEYDRDGYTRAKTEFVEKCNIANLVEKGQNIYKVDYHGQKNRFAGAKENYAEGTEVDISYSLIATDTDYTFYVDGQKVSAEWNSKKGYIVRFTMPGHDIEVYCIEKNAMKV